MPLLTELSPQPIQIDSPVQSQTDRSDPFGRKIGYLRLSLTKSCAMRCLYCRPATLENSRENYLRTNEITSLVKWLAEHYGLKKVRITGGDPTNRPDLISIIESLSNIHGINDLAMSTHGLTLHAKAKDYAAAGLRRINVSLDSLQPKRFANITGVDGLSQVLKGLEAARTAGLTPIRINTVVLRNQNEDELIDLVQFAAKQGFEIRFIELMPMGPLASQWNDLYVSESQMKAQLNRHIVEWNPLPHLSESARRHHVKLIDGTTTTIGFITPMSCNFCGSCNRIRIAADGAVFPCLMDNPSSSILPAFRPIFDPSLLERILHESLNSKQKEHPHAGPAVMTHIGG